MNAFGKLYRVTIIGESHGPAVGVIIDGVPPGLPLSADDFHEDIERRKGGMQKGTRRVRKTTSRYFRPDCSMAIVRVHP